MPMVDVFDIEGNKTGSIELNDNIFAAKVSEPSMHAAVVNYLANQRQGTQNTKTRSEVRGGGRKPWRQKGTGRARQGSIRSPQWTGGGVALGPKPRDYSYSINRKIKRIALKSALTTKVIDNNIIIVENFDISEPKTKFMAKALNNLKVEGKALIVTGQKEDKVVRSASNLKGVTTTLATTLNTYEILKHDKFIATKDAISKIEEVYA